MIRSFSLFFIYLGITFCARAQTYQPIFPNLSGQELYDSVVAHYKPVTILDYANSRDTLYAKVLAFDDDSLRCIYSGYTLYLDPTQDPTQYIYFDGSPLGMNTEHAYPQAKGASEGNARSDMHHLYPTRIPVNEARGNKPYAEIPDNQTKEWYINAQKYLSIPTQNIDLYSESNDTAFEPRESVKGELARAIFYFYTMYRTEALLADPNYFGPQRPTLCQWHTQHPADSAELIKTWRIAPYQENKPNPFILDCTLARRIYCPELSTDCTSATFETTRKPFGLRLSPNPMQQSGRLEMNLPYSGNVEIRLYSLTGIELAKWSVPEVDSGHFQFDVEMSANRVPGPAFWEVRLTNSTRALREVLPVVMQ